MTSARLCLTHRSQTWPASPETFWVCWFYCGGWQEAAGGPGEEDGSQWRVRVSDDQQQSKQPQEFHKNSFLDKS